MVYATLRTRCEIQILFDKNRNDAYNIIYWSVGGIQLSIFWEHNLSAKTSIFLSQTLEMRENQGAKKNCTEMELQLVLNADPMHITSNTWITTYKSIAILWTTDINVTNTCNYNVPQSLQKSHPVETIEWNVR